jgi:hypothetical protein
MEGPYRNAGSHHLRSRWLALSTHHAIHQCVGRDEETFADAVKTDEGSTHKDLSVDLASDASNLATATGFRLVRQSAAIESLVFCGLDLLAMSIIRCTLKLTIASGCCVSQEHRCPFRQI